MATKSRSFRTDDEEGRRLPRWLPITLLAVTTVSLTVPVILLLRQKKTLGRETVAGLGRKQNMTAPPARRRPLNPLGSTKATAGSSATMASSPGSASSIPPPRRAPSRLNLLEAKSSLNRQSQAAEVPVSLFDNPLLPLGALGLATAAVGVGAVFSVWGVQKLLGVQSVDEFAARVHKLLLSHMPALSQRLYRPSSDDVGVLPSSSHEDVERELPQGEWTYESSEDRLRTAFDRGGVGEWANCAIRELETEARVERKKRGL